MKAIDAWATELRQRFGGRAVAVCLEQSKGGVIYALMKYGYSNFEELRALAF